MLTLFWDGPRKLRHISCHRLDKKMVVHVPFGGEKGGRLKKMQNAQLHLKIMHKDGRCSNPLPAVRQVKLIVLNTRRSHGALLLTLRMSALKICFYSRWKTKYREKKKHNLHCIVTGSGFLYSNLAFCNKVE